MIFMLKIKCNINFNVHVFCLISKEKKINCLMHDRKQRENFNSERVFTNIRNIFELNKIISSCCTFKSYKLTPRTGYHDHF